MRSRHASLNQLRPVFDGCDSGAYSLPTGVLDLRSALEALEAFELPSPDPEAERTRLVAGLVDGARKGGKWPTAGPVVAAIAARAEVEELKAAVDEAVEQVARDLNAAVVSGIDNIIGDHLRPVHDRALADGRTAVAEITEAGADPAAVLHTAEVTLAPAFHEPRLRLATAHADYAAVGHAHRTLITGRLQQRDAEMFSWTPRYAELWPGHVTRRTPPPWPADDPLSFFVWLVGSDAQPWLPTLEQLDRRYADHTAAHQAAAKNATMVAAGAVRVPAS